MPFLRISLLGVLGLICGCGPEMAATSPEGTVWGEPYKTAILEPFQGNWKFQRRQIEDEEQTPGAARITGGPDLQIEGHIITEQTVLQSEYRLFEVHEHEGRICGKAWLHEDPHDPGDMSKVLVTLAVVGDKLTFRTRHANRSASPNDPDSQGDIPVLSKTPTECPVAQAQDEDWGPWVTFDYTRAK